MMFSQQEWEAIALYVCFPFGAYALRLVYGRKKVPWLEAVLDGFAAVGAGAFIGSVVSIQPFPLPAKLAMASLAALVGPDLLSGILTIAKEFKNSPSQFILKYIYAVRGVKTGMDIPTPEEEKDHPKEK